MSTDVFKKRLLNSLKRLDASAAVVLAFAVCSGSKQNDVPLLSEANDSFFNKCISVFSQKKSLIGVISIGLVAAYGFIYQRMSSLKHKALNDTPLLDWFDSIDCCYEGKRLCLLRKVVRDFAQKDNCSELYELIDDNVRVSTLSVEAFLVAAKKEEEILRAYITLQAWAETFFLSGLLPGSKQETNCIKKKLEYVVTMQEII